MLGQISLFKQEEDLPLRRRVTVEIINYQDAKYMTEKFHYLHRMRAGRQINYAVLIDGIVDGIITYAYPMVIGTIAGISTNEIIEFARMFLYQNIPHSATCAIGKTIKRIKSDWKTYFPDAPIPKLIVSWSDATLHKGTVYKAANFEFYHRSKPSNKTTSGWGDRSKTSLERPDYTHEKDCWLYWLIKKPETEQWSD